MNSRTNLHLSKIFFKAIFLGVTLFILLLSNSNSVLAVTPPTMSGAISKPAGLVLVLPWTSGRSVYIGPGYGANDHHNQDAYALDFWIQQGSGGASGHDKDIRAVASGTVVWSGWYQPSGTSTWKCYGNSIAIKHDTAGFANYISFYTHLSTISLQDKDPNTPGIQVNQGDVIGLVGDSGLALEGCFGSGSHLHFVLINDDNLNGDSNILTGNETQPPHGGKPVVPEPFVGQKVYEGFGLTWPGQSTNGWKGPMIAADLGSDSPSGMPGGTWSSNATTNTSLIQKGQKITFSVDGLSSDTKEVRFTAGYANWSLMSPMLNNAVWRIISRCTLDKNKNPISDPNRCNWSPDRSHLDYSWDPYNDLVSDALWLPSGSTPTSTYVNPPYITPTGSGQNPVCISFDVFDQAGNANYAPNGVNCSVGALNSTQSLAPNPANQIQGLSQAPTLLQTIDNSGRLIYVASYSPYPSSSWLQEFSKAERPPLNVDIHIRVGWDSNFDAFRICFDDNNCQETSATELFYTWNTYGWADGNHMLTIQYRRKSDNGNWANALSYSEQFYLSPNRSGYASCDGGDGVYLISGSDCIRLTTSQHDLAPIGWADRSDLYVSVSGSYQAWVYDGVDYQGYTRVVNSGQNISVGGNVSSVNIVAAPPPPPPVPTAPFACDPNTISLYHFDEGSGSTVYDSCGTVNGNVSSGSWISGQFGNALAFYNPPDGPTVNFGAPSAFNLCPMSAEMWLRVRGDGRVAGQLAGGGNTGQNRWLVSIEASKPKLEIWSGGGSQAVTSYKDITDSNWHLVAFSFDCSTTGKLYLDNELVGTLTTAGVWPSANTTFEVGSAEGVYRFNGDVDEVRISNTIRVPKWTQPIANFSADSVNGNAPLSVSFSDTSTGSIAGWSWDFGDSTTSTDENPIHYFNAPGDYSVKLTVIGPGGADTEIQSSLIHVSPQLLLVASPSFINSGQTIQVNWSGFEASGNDWISMHPAGQPDSSYLTWKSVTGASGSVQFIAPSTPGNYDFRLFRNGTKVATSNIVSVVVNPIMLTLNLGNTLKNRSVTIELRSLNAPIFTTSTISDMNGGITNLMMGGVSPGTYNLLVKPQGWLSRQQQVTLVSGSNPFNFASSFYNFGGDLDENNVINILDFQILSNEFGTTNSLSDLNADGYVNIIDFQILSNSFGKVGDGSIISAGASTIVKTVPAVADSTGVWAITGSMNTPRWYQTATLLLNGRVLVTGGYNNGALASAELYDPSTGVWTVTGSMASARFAHSAILLPSGKVLVAGGLNGSWTALTSAELYDPATGLWASAGSMGGARFNHTATILSSGKVLVVGGSGPSGVGPLASAELYNPSTNLWTATSSMSIARASHTATLLSNGKILITGGIGAVSLSSAELYDATTGNWTTTGTMTNARAAHTATLLQDGKVLAAGGLSTNNVYLFSGEIYDPVSGIWTAASSLTYGRENHAATLLPNGKVLISGGWNSNLGGYLSSAELYDPSLGAWTATSSVSFARSDHPAVLLLNGNVLAVGGNSASGIRASAELYALPNVNVVVGGAKQGSYYVPPHGSQRVTYALDSGPVQVASSNAVNLIAALRDAWLVNGQVTSFAQLMGLPKAALSDTYYFPAYNNLTLSGQLRIANVDTVATDVTVTIAGVDYGPYHLNPSESVRPTYPLDAGPVVVHSSGGTKIIAALRDAWLVNGQVTSFVQLMGLPKEQLSDTYFFPAYNNLSLSGQLRIGNVDTVATDVTVTIAGVPHGPYHLNPNQSARPTYPLDAGPVVVHSSGGVKIIAALRDAWLSNGQVTSFAQLMGLPQAQLSDTYLFPAYNNLTLSGQLRIGNVDTVATDVKVTIAGVDYGPYHLNPNQSVRPTYPLDAGPVVIHSSGGVKIIAALRDAWLSNGQVTSFAQLMGLPQAALSTTYYFPAYNNVTLSDQLRFGVP